jgi:hypothetical protein
MSIIITNNLTVGRCGSEEEMKKVSPQNLTEDAKMAVILLWSL